MKYEILRTDTADAGLRRIILYVAQNFGNDIALEKLDEIEARINILADNPYIGSDSNHYAVVDQRQDYLNIIRGL